jgi:hypothetical protein
MSTSKTRRGGCWPLLLSAATLLSWSCRTAEPAPPAEKPVEVASAACGSTGQPECPTQHWMKATLQAYLRTHDYKRMEASFNDLAAHGPADFERWQALAKSGASAAATADETSVRKTCQDCHDSYRAEFRRRYRNVVFL